ncbi:hypothetical protein RFN28_34750, partial [Mesorhizobium sp. VK24D]
MVELLCCVQARDHRGLVAIGSPGTADPHRQAAAHAKDGARRSCCWARSGAAAGKKIAVALLRGTGRVADRIPGQIRPEQGPSVAGHHGT